MMLTGPQVIGELRGKLPMNVGRHLYAVLGTYAQLEQFETLHLAQARDADGQPFPTPVNVNYALLARIADDDLKQLVRDEPRRPQAVQRRLNLELQALLDEALAASCFVILKQLELLWAYELELTVFRTRAANQNHILLLLPGERRGEHITIFHEAEARFHRALPGNLITETHLWELDHG
jgi:hypothetical protein